jgi:hypothetical protein
MNERDRPEPIKPQGPCFSRPSCCCSRHPGPASCAGLLNLWDRQRTQKGLVSGDDFVQPNGYNVSSEDPDVTTSREVLPPQESQKFI